MNDNHWWSNTSICVERERELWDRIRESKIEEPVPQFIEVYTYGADGNTKFVLDQNPYGERVTYAYAKKLGVQLMGSGFEFNRRLGDLLVSMSETALVVLYWH